MRVLVTGGAGFIGSHLTEALLSVGDEVHVADIKPPSLEPHERLRVWEADLRTNGLAHSLVQNVDSVVHLAATCGVRNIVDFPATSMLNNLALTESVLKACSIEGKPVIIASSSEVFGSNLSEPLAEDSPRQLGPPWKVRWSYGYAKALEEAMAFAMAKQDGLKVTVVRPFNVTGPRHGNGRAVIPTFVHQAMHDDPLTVYGDGTQNRCFLHIDDFVAAMLLLLEGEHTNEAFNIGRADRVSMNELAELVLELTDAGQSVSPVVHVPYADVYEAEFEDVQGRACDSSKLQLKTGWEPEYDTRAIVQDTVDWMRKHG